MQTREHRRVAKVINFGVIYGLSAFGLAQQLDIDQKEAAKFIAAYFERYSGVKKYLDQQIAEVRRTGISKDSFRPHPSDFGNQFTPAEHAQFCRAHRDEYAHAGRRRGPDQARDDRA